ncbi:uncharacterized protein LOC124366215 isoform X4 [Homalodisca vitripennis]|uniref:uncharacterized protein LOC124366215 isoform X4 n=1 Tax=Homalodisca vitripennis TaxID=197043 RepID=UPI001EEBDD6E|nr:uncharacterized protein LOC124366215 isoform X4 [Homalodisca vitripennis]
MMARLLTEEATAASVPEPGLMGDSSKPQHASTRKLSFKTRQASSRSNYRATKVSLSSTNVALIASKFNTIVVEDSNQARVLLRKVSNNQRSKEIKGRPINARAEGMVKAAIEIFEHQEEKTKNKPVVKKGSDSRPKFLVVRKSSSRSSVKLEDLPKIETTKKLDSLSKESAKDSTDSFEIKSTEMTVGIKEVKRKPSLKAKPVSRHNPPKKLESDLPLNQKIAKFNVNSTTASTNSSSRAHANQDIKKMNINLNERIAQFSKIEEDKMLLEKKSSIVKMGKSITENSKKVTFDPEEKENKQEVKKSILRNSKNRTGLVEQTKDRLASIASQNNFSNQPNSVKHLDKKQSLNKGKFVINDKKEFSVFQNVPEITNTSDLVDYKIYNKLSVPKTINNLDDNKLSQSSELSVDASPKHTKPSDDAKLSVYSQKDYRIIVDGKDLKNDTSELKTNIKINSPLKESGCTLKSSIKPLSSESPKLEKKTLCVATDPSESIQLDKIKPNSSFLWKPASRMSMVTDIPIYDDRPESQISGNVLDSVRSGENVEQQEKETCNTEDTKTANSLDLDVASSFILEMTEQIDRRFSNGSVHDKDSDEKSFKSSLEEVSENVSLKVKPFPKTNTSFLYGKSSSNDDVFTETTKKESSSILKSDGLQISKTTKVPPPVSKKPSRTVIGDSPPQLPEKNARISEIVSGNVNLNAPPPVPPSHTKPKLMYTPSEETWLENCDKILKIPPPLRKQKAQTSPEAQLDLATSHSRRSPKDHGKISDSEKRFSVSQDELLRRMSEMNLANKRNSLPSGSYSFSSSYVEPEQEEEEDHYCSIQQFQKKDVDDQDTYEAIGENNYAEISEFQREEREDNNIYDDVLDPEDHYEAINCELVRGDSDSSCDQSNSLYGLTRPTSAAVPGGVYQMTGGSETSDEWVDLDNSDDQHEPVFIFREKERGRSVSAAESWSAKVRRQWSRQAADGDDVFLGELALPPPQLQRRVGINRDGSEESVPRHGDIENIDETSYCDDFDDSLSDSSFDQETTHPNTQQVAEEKRVQPLTEGIYGFMKQAGQQMRKHWALGKSLTRMRKNKSTSSIIQGTGDLGRRGWSFKSRDKPSSAQSTFYLHTNTLPRGNSPQEVKIDPRRLSTASIVARPTSPPPPPPPRNSIDGSSKRNSRLNNSNSSGDNEGYVEGQRRLSRNGNSMWYVETSTDTASENGSSSQGSDLNLRFADEPLYQFYAANIAEMTLSELTEGETDGYEEITAPAVPSALDLVSVTHHCSLWCEVPQVRNSGVLDTLTQSQKRLQEAKFEVMTSEASYFKSLTVLDKLFSSCPLFCDENILSRDDRRVLFGNVTSVRRCSEKLLAALQACWQDCILLQGLCDVVHDHVVSYRDVYINYCTNQISMDRTLKMLKQTNSNFITVLTQLESDAECQSLTLYSFLMLPMQRITRLRLLFETMLTLLDQSDAEFPSCKRTLEVLNKCVAECNEGARSQERLEEMVRLSKQLDFPAEMNVPILGEGSNRWLVRSGQVTQVNMDAKQTFGRRLSRTGPKFTLFLFTDLLVVTKKKSEDSYLVVDHCQRSLVEMQEMRDFPGNNRFLLQVTLLENADSKTVEMTLSCDSETDRQRWLQVSSPPQSEAPGETLYEGWDCPQVTAIHNYLPSQPDELNLALGDIVNVLRKTEGWFYGERTRDGEKGWFPGNYTREIASKHVRARNLKQRHRLLQLSADFVQQKKKVK